MLYVSIPDCPFGFLHLPQVNDFLRENCYFSINNTDRNSLAEMF